MTWAFASAFDSYRSGTATKDDMNSHKLQDKGRVGIADLFVFKKSILSELLGGELQRLHLPVDQVRLLQKHYESHATYKNSCGFDDPVKAKFDKKPDLTWQTQMSKTTLRYSQLIEMAIYSNHFDGVLRQCLKNSKSPEDSLRYGTLGVQLQQVYDVMEAENASATAAPGGPARLRMFPQMAAAVQMLQQATQTRRRTMVTRLRVTRRPSQRRAGSRMRHP